MKLANDFDFTVTGGARKVRTVEKKRLHKKKYLRKVPGRELRQDEAKAAALTAALKAKEQEFRILEQEHNETKLKTRRSNLALVCVMEERNHLGLQAGGWKLVAKHYRGDNN